MSKLIEHLNMDVNDTNVLEKINTLIATNRLSRNQILQLVNLATISYNINELEENIKWETFKSNKIKRL